MRGSGIWQSVLLLVLMFGSIAALVQCQNRTCARKRCKDPTERSMMVNGYCLCIEEPR